ncbi:hypothetical protein BK636_04040 [Pseudomonas chlororaphis]|nr:hypothetical protein BK636_04040 [Pseudomonas chlororaphis]
MIFPFVQFGDEDTVIAVKFKSKIFIDLGCCGVTADPANRFQPRIFNILIAIQMLDEYLASLSVIAAFLVEIPCDQKNRHLLPLVFIMGTPGMPIAGTQWASI